MHQPDKIGEVELATISFGQSFQITPIRLMTTVAGLINGGKLVTPHFAVKAVNADNTVVDEFHIQYRRELYPQIQRRNLNMY